MKTSNTVSAANLRGMAKHTYNRVITAMTEDNDASLLHTFNALTDQAKSIVLQSGKFSNAYVRGELKEITIEEAAKDLTARATACVSCKVRNIDLIVATAFLAEYISRQRKAIEAPKPTTAVATETMNANNTPDISDLANWVNFQLSTIIEGTSACYTLGNNNSVWIDRGATIFTVALATDEEIEIDSANYATAEEIAKAIISILNTNPATMNELSTVEFSELSHAATNIVLTAENDGNIYRRYVEPLRVSLVKKIQRAINPDPKRLAQSSVMRLIIAAAIAEMYCAGWLEGCTKVTAAERKEAAKYLAAAYISDAEEEYNYMMKAYKNA